MKRLLLTLVCVLAWAAPSDAAVAAISGQFVGSCASADISPTLPGAVTAGDLVVITAALQSGTATAAITGNDFTFTVTGPNTSSNGVRTYQWWGIGGTDSAYTVDQSGVVAMCVTVTEYSGADTSSPVDVSCSPNTTTASSHTCTNSLTVQTANGVIVAMVCSDSTVTWVTTPTSPAYNRRDSFTSANRCAMSDRITATTETFGDDTWTTSGTENVGGLIVSYKEAGAASLVSHWPLSLGGFGQ